MFKWMRSASQQPFTVARRRRTARRLTIDSWRGVDGLFASGSDVGVAVVHVGVLDRGVPPATRGARFVGEASPTGAIVRDQLNAHADLFFERKHAVAAAQVMKCAASELQSPGGTRTDAGEATTPSLDQATTIAEAQ